MKRERGGYPRGGKGVVPARAAFETVVLFGRRGKHVTHENDVSDFELLFNTLPDGVFVADRATGRVVAANATGAQIYGYAPAELVGLNISELSAEPLQTTKALSDGFAPVQLRVHKRKDGTTFIAEVSSRLIHWGGREAYAGVIRDVSQRKRLEDELRDSKQLLSNAFHNSPLLMSIADVVTDKYIEVNDSFCTVSGFSREEMIGKSALELGLIDAKERDRLGQLLMAAGGKGNFELLIHSKNGAPILCRYWGEVVHSAGGPQLFAAAEDITQRKQSEKAREEALARLEKIASRVPGVVYQFRLRPDGSSCFPFSSAAIREIYRVTPEEVQDDAAKVFTRLHPEDFDAVVASIQKSARDLTPWRDEYRVKFEDGVVRWLRGNAVPEREPDGSVLWHGFISDITAQKQAADALEKSNQRFALAMDATSDGLWDWDITTDDAYFSPGYYRMLGFDADSFPSGGSTWRDLIHPDDRERAQQLSLDCIEGRSERIEIEYRLKSKQGEYRWVLSRGQCLARDAKGRALRLLGTHVDITDRKRLQAGLAQNDRLASMGMLAAGVAHEINNPLAYVLSHLDALADELPQLGSDEPVKPAQLKDLVESARSALEGTRRIRKISRGLGTFSRAERSELASVDLNLAIETAATMAHNEVKYRANLVKDFGPIPLILASDGKLAQVFLNLIINAAHAIPEGNVERNRIGIRTWCDGPNVFAEVTDTGHGIPPENLERIFEPFFTTKKVGAGSGLGLPISKNIVTEFGGELRIASEVGKGTRVLVRLPVGVVKDDPPEALVARRAPAPEARGRILVVDDEQPIRKILARLLSPPHEVLTVASGREARTLLEKDRAFDLILCDLMMPEMTGMELHAWMVAQAPELARRVVFISGGAFTPHASDYLASVDNVRLDKPFDPGRLREIAAERVAAVRSGTVT